MTPQLLYRISAVILALFAIGHTIGFRNVDPKWGADAVVSGMRQTQFRVAGFDRSYWDFFEGFGFFVTVFLAFAAVLSWRWGSTPADRLATMTVERWAFAACFVAVCVLSWRYFFTPPGVLSTIGALTLVVAALL
jgi:hypothetical protein